MKKLKQSFFERDTLDVAKDLLGKILVCIKDGEVCKGRIVETEAYIGSIDKACHAYGGRRTQKTEPLYGKPYIAYIYSIYGMYLCFNIITKKENEPEGVLIRALEPIEGKDIMAKRRFEKDYNELKNSEIKGLTNGPAKLCIAMNITKDMNKFDMNNSDLLYVIDDGFKVENIVESKRIGIDYAEEAKDFLWRFYIKDNKYISKK